MARSAVEDETAAGDAKRLLRVSRTGALATLDGSAPLTTLIGVASDWDGAPLFLVSDLARHASNLAADNRASLLLISDNPKGDPLNNPRLTLNGRVVRTQEPSARQRYLRRNPKSKLYIDFADFSLRRFEVDAIHFNGGFGRADKLTWPELATPGDFLDLAAAEDALLSEMESLDQGEIDRMAGNSAPAGAWRPVGIDAEGVDLSSGRWAGRIDFLTPAADPEGWRAALDQRQKD